MVELACFFLTNLSVMMKHPSFMEEDEYRLLRIIYHSGTAGLGGINFRPVGNRMVPFDTLNFLLKRCER